MNTAQIRKQLADKGIKVTASQIKKKAAAIGLEGTEWDITESQALMDAIADIRDDAGVNRSVNRPSDKQYNDFCDNSELSITSELQQHAIALQQEKAAIAQGIARAADSFADDLAEMVVQFKPLVYARTAEKLRAIRERDTGHSIAAAFSETFDAIATSHSDVALLPEATGYAR